MSIFTLQILFKKYYLPKSILEDCDEQLDILLPPYEKPLFLFFTGSDWCGWCIKLQKAVFSKPEFEAWANKSVILVELDFPRRTKISESLQKQNRDLANMFGVRGYPTVWFVSPKPEKENINFVKLGQQGASPLEVKSWITAANKIIAIK